VHLSGVHPIFMDAEVTAVLPLLFVALLGWVMDGFAAICSLSDPGENT
jgi:hypothetical protein